MKCPIQNREDYCCRECAFYDEDDECCIVWAIKQDVKDLRGFVRDVRNELRLLSKSISLRKERR